MGRAAAEGRRIRIQGTVQGVGFRPWVYRAAEASGVTGRVLNDSAGVVIEAFGEAPALDRFEKALHGSPPPAAHIALYSTVSIAPEGPGAFAIVDSRRSAAPRLSIPPDLATCDDCVSEIFDPSNRRYRYPFTNCTNCGPRMTIATDTPYDRVNTTMAPFGMCEPCRHEYENVADRRFHAQPTACPECGPTLTFCGSDGEMLAMGKGQLKPEPTDADQKIRLRPDSVEGHATIVVGSGFSRIDPIALAAQAIREGWIVALKGIGGFHLACDATSESAVDRLRRKKHRDEKPLAVMMPALQDAEMVAVLGDEERQLLTSVERPIVLAAKRDIGTLAESVAPRNRQLGLMLPYSPLHHLLLHDVGRPIVMTSGNLSEDPIAFSNEDAFARLGNVADFFLVHDRAIETGADDSVVSVIAGRGVVLRRSRGYVPRNMRVASAFARPVLACGALLKNTFCLAAGEHAWLGPHIGDLENLETFDSYTAAISKFERFLQVRPEVIAHDLHPDYLSTRYAFSRSDVTTIGVQHHHAHIVSAMAEHGLDGPVIGLAYDGTGYGTDGTSWGGEVMVATAGSFNRLATFRPISLVGGDRAIREPWRIAVALALDAYDGVVPAEVWALLKTVSPQELTTMASLLRTRDQGPRAHGVGRYFDGFGAMFLDRRRSSFEGQVALEWNQTADANVRQAYPFAIDLAAEPWELDLRPAFRAAVSERLRGVRVPVIAAAFHNTLIQATAALVRRVADQAGRLPVVASGGCFQNPRLAEGVSNALFDFDVCLHERVPPGDGGIALGQAVIADAVVRSGSSTDSEGGS